MHRKSLEDRARIMVDKILVDRKVHPLAEEIKLYDKELYKHSLNVAFITAQIVCQMDYTKAKQYDIITAALLHDVGKLQIPIDIIRKDRHLTTEEFEIVKTHVEEGIKILKEAEFNDLIIRCVGTHHELLDGTGYPKGLDKTKLREEDLILGAVDKYDALTSKRTYGREYTSYEAFGILLHEGNIDVNCLHFISECEAK